MTLEDKKEIIRANFYNVPENLILETYSISKEEFEKILKENQEYIKELEERDYA